MPTKDQTILIFNDTRNNGHYGCQGVMAAIETIVDISTESADIDLYPLALSAMKNERPGWLLHEDLVRNLLRARMIIVNGEGSIHHSNRRARGLSMIAPFAQALTMPAFLINATLFENDSVTLDEIAKYSRVYCRDQFSYKLLQRKEIDAHYAPDLTFFHDLEKVVSANAGKGICVTESVLTKVSDKLDQWSQQNGYSRRTIIGDVNKTPTFESYVSDLKNFELVVTGRYHDVCFCINAKIPFVAIESNTNKIANVLNDVFGNCSRLVSVDQLDTVDLQKLSSYTSVELEKIEAFKEMAQKSFNILTHDIRDTWQSNLERNDISLVEKVVAQFERNGAKPLTFGYWQRQKLKKYVNKYFNK